MYNTTWAPYTMFSEKTKAAGSSKFGYVIFLMRYAVVINY